LGRERKRALAPSRYLIHYLLKEHKAFLAQVKIPHNEDPVLGIFKVLLESYLNGDEKISFAYYHIMLKTYLGHLKLPVPQNLENLLTTFKGDLGTIGVLEAFRKFFFSLGLSNSNHTHNMQLLASLININLENIELIWDQMNQGRNSKYSFEFQLGKGGGKLKIMTVHASKGLEFDHVILGGIHVKSTPPSSSNIMGKGPTALLWKEKQGKGKFLLSPGYILEKGIESKKESSESKRLLYVACTRPKKSLSWVDVSIGGKKQKWGTDPWILAFRKMEGEITARELNLDPNLVFSGENLDNPTPFFHKGAQGMAPKIGHLADIHKLGTISELSVTRLATLLDCPRKFYLQNICRLDDGDLDRYYGEEFDEVSDIKSSSKRGTRVHAQISKIIMREDIQNIKAEDEKAIAFARTKLENLGDAQFISEKQIKFPLFGYMCSGIPDLIVLPKGGNLKIIDFKTGSYLEKGPDSYWFQLSCYAYAAYYLKLLKQDKEIDLELYYLDEEKVLTQTFNFKRLKKSLFSTWEKLYNLSQVNPDHCPSCKFGKMCFPTVAGRPSYDKINTDI
jgi:CRISPR/Cas system-associated exonuclease Cas4 (RecB family)